MGSWLSDAFSNINLNPTYSPVYQQTVAPALDAAGVAIFGVPAGTILTTAANAIDPHKAAPAPTYYPAPYTPPTGTVAAPATGGTTAAAPASATAKYVMWGVAGVAALGLGWMIYKSSGRRKHA
jgi:hypothetical protein